MFDDSVEKNNLILDTSNIVLPYGWKVLSHGTGFNKWEKPFSQYPSQDLHNSDRIVVSNTADNGLACVDGEQGNVSMLYAASGDPLIMKIVVPGDLSSFDIKTAEDALRFAVQGDNSQLTGLVPSNTTLVKIGEEENPGSVPVIWYVPEQFYFPFEKSLKETNKFKENSRNANLVEEELELDRASSFGIPVVDDNDNVLPVEKNDKYFETLAEDLALAVEGEVEQEIELEKKRKDDRQKGWEQDKDNIAKTRAEIDTQMGAANAGKTPSTSTVQNPRNKTVPDTRSAAGVETPPDAQLSFKEEKFRAIRKLGVSLGTNTAQIGTTLASGVVYTAAGDPSGTASTMLQTYRGIVSIKRTYDAFTHGSGSHSAKKIWKKHCDEAGLSSKEAVRQFGKFNAKNIGKKLDSTLPSSVSEQHSKKFGKAADVSVLEAVGKKHKYINHKVDVLTANGKIGQLRDRSTDLKNRIKELNVKSDKLTRAEKNLYVDLRAKKQQIDKELRNLVGATNARRKQEEIFAQIRRMSSSKLTKEISRIEKSLKKGTILSNTQRIQLAAMKERSALLKMQEAVGKRGRFTRIRALSGLSLHMIGKTMRESGDDTFAYMTMVGGTIMRAPRSMTVRLTRKLIKWSVKLQLKTVKLATLPIRVLDKKLGISTATKKAVGKAKDKVTSKILHSKPIKVVKKPGIAGSRLRSSRLTSGLKVAKGVKKTEKANREIRKQITKKSVKLAGKAGPKAKRLAKKTAKKIEKLNKSTKRFARGASAVIKLPKTIVISIAILIVVLVLISTIAAGLSSASSSLIMTDSDPNTGKINLAPFVQILNEEEAKLTQQINDLKAQTKENGGEYTRVYVEYYGSGQPHNYKEIISMMAVRFVQNFDIPEEDYQSYMRNLYNAANYVTTEESETYYCSGCISRDYHCYDEPDEYATSERRGLYAKSDHGDEGKGCKLEDSEYYCDGKHTEDICEGHIDLHINITRLGFDDIFSADNSTSLDLDDYTQGDLIGSFKITYYCTEKYAHICNDAPEGGEDDGLTATGTKVTPGRTVAVDPSVIPYGTELVIGGHVYVAEDCGGAIKENRIDIAVETHEEALSLGTNILNVYYAVPGESDVSEDSYGFTVWDEDNREWAKTLCELMTSELYAGLDGIVVSGGGGNGSVPLDGIEIKGSKITVKYYSQTDPRWSQIPIMSGYPSQTIGTSGCGFTSMAIVVSSLTDITLDPPGMVERYGNVYYLPNAGAYWSIVSGVAGDYGLSCNELAVTDVQGVINALDQGKLVVALVGSGGYGYTGNGHYIGAGHFLVICGVTEDGNFLLADPNDVGASTGGSGVDMQHFLNSGIKTWWAVGK